MLERRNDRREPSFRVSMGQLGMWVLFVSLSVLFVAACMAVIITRSQVQVWRLPGQAGLPWGTAASSALIIVVSWQLQAALHAIRANAFDACSRKLRWGGAAALAFLFAQAVNARLLMELEGRLATQTLFVFSYFLLVGLHAAHVLGGFIPLAIVQAKVQRQEYSSSRHAALLFCVQYWHYLAVVWFVLLATLIWVGRV
jgi:cytochrome c oxidase subunit III